MNGHGHRVAALAVSNLDIIEISSEAGILGGLDDNARRVSALDCHRACIASEHERWTCTDWECTRWLSHTVSKGLSDPETESEKRSNES